MKGRCSTDDIVRVVSDAHGLTLANSRRVLDTIFGFIADSVSNGNQVSISKFGAFVPARSKAYTARNPKTGAPVKVPAKNRVRFRPFTGLKDTISC